MGFSRLAVSALVLTTIITPAAAQVPRGSSSSKPHAHASEATSTDAGAIVDGVYRNDWLNLSYKVPFGWVDRTTDMQEGSEPGKSMLLLSLFERPPEAPTGGINPSTVIAAESKSSYPGLKSPDEYLGPIQELATARGFKPDGAPYEFVVGGKRVVRQDFARGSGDSAVRQTSLVYVQKNWIISLTFLGSSQDEVDDLVGKLSFGGAISPPKTGNKAHPDPAKPL